MANELETSSDMCETSSSLECSLNDSDKQERINHWKEENEERQRILLKLDKMCNSLYTTAYPGFSEFELSELQNLRMGMLHRLFYDRYIHLKEFVEKMQNNGSSEEKIAKCLSLAECWLSDVVLLSNVTLTKIFIREQEKVYNEESEGFVSAETAMMRNLRFKLAFPNCKVSFIDDDSRDSVDFVMFNCDVDSVELILMNGPGKENRARRFFEDLGTLSTTHLNYQASKYFAEKALIEWKIFDEEASKIIEVEIFQKACLEVIEMFLMLKVHANVNKLFKRNILLALYGNPYASLVYIKRFNIDVHKARGNDNYTALHYAMQNSLIEKVKFLLDYGVNPHSLNSKNETPLILAVKKPQVYSSENKSCAELLLKFGANPFWRSFKGLSFDSCISSDFALKSKYLVELAMAYALMYKATIANNQSDNYYDAIQDSVYLFNFYVRCKQQIRVLKEDRIRNDMSMFTILSTTGDQLVRILDENDRRIISNYMLTYRREKRLNVYYFNAIKEHMKQFRKLVTCKNRAIMALSQQSPVLANCHMVLDKIVSFLTIEDLLKFQFVSTQIKVCVETY